MLKSRFFTVQEFACKSGTPDPGLWTPYPAEWIDTRLQDLVEVLDVVRETWCAPVEVVSGFRTDAYNAHLRERSTGVAEHSQHPQGRAADVRPLNPTPERVADFIAMIEQLIGLKALPKLGGFGRYPGWAHLDVRPRPADGHLARWDGAGFGSEPVA